MLFRAWEEIDDQAWDHRRPVRTVIDGLGRPHVLVAGYAEVKAVLADPGTYRPDNALDAVTPVPVSALRVLSRYGFRLPPTLANNGGMSHPGIREIVARALHPDRVEEQRSWLTGVVAHRVAGLSARLRDGSPVDLYAELAADLPLLVLARLVELPASRAAVVKEFSRAALELFWAPLVPDRQRHLAEVVGRYHEVLRDFAADAGGMVGELRALAKAAGLPRDVPVAALFFLLVAGQETTSQFLTLLLHRLAGEPDVLRGLCTGTVAVDDVVEEGLRLVPPIVTWRRVAARDTTLAGVPIPAGRDLVLWLARAGRDPALTASPDELRPGQPGSRRHLAFGAGVHRCVGAQLSRMEAAVVVGQTAPLLRDIEVLRPPWCPDNLSFRMPDAFVVRRRPATAAGTSRSARAAADPRRRPAAAAPGRLARTAAG
jgi:cytochrome P450